MKAMEKCASFAKSTRWRSFLLLKILILSWRELEEGWAEDWLWFCCNLWMWWKQGWYWRDMDQYAIDFVDSFFWWDLLSNVTLEKIFGWLRTFFVYLFDLISVPDSNRNFSLLKRLNLIQSIYFYLYCESYSAWRGLWGIITLIYKQEGWRGFWKGTAPGLFRIVPGAGMNFFFLNQISSYLKKKENNKVIFHDSTRFNEQGTEWTRSYFHWISCKSSCDYDCHAIDCDQDSIWVSHLWNCVDLQGDLEPIDIVVH